MLSLKPLVNANKSSTSLFYYVLVAKRVTNYSANSWNLLIVKEGSFSNHLNAYSPKGMLEL